MTVETYAMHRLYEDRVHVLSDDCWCGPRKLAYGEEPVTDEQGEVIGYTRSVADDDADED